MSVLESVQVTVGLTKNKEVLKQLRTNRMFRKDAEGEYLSLQFDGQEFRFRPNKKFVVGKAVANAMIRSSAVLVGNDALSDPFLPYVEAIEEHDLAKGESTSQFACPLCGVDTESAPRLARHLMTKHKDDPRMKDDKKVDYDTPIDEQLGSKSPEGDSPDGGEDVESFGTEKE